MLSFLPPLYEDARLNAPPAIGSPRTAQTQHQFDAGDLIFCAMQTHDAEQLKELLAYSLIKHKLKLNFSASLRKQHTGFHFFC